MDSINKAVLEDQDIRSYMANLIKEEEDSEPSDRFEDLRYHFRDLIRYSSSPDYSASQQIAQTFETRDNTLVQNFAVILSGLLGGVMGAAFTVLLTNADVNDAPEVENQLAAPTVPVPGETTNPAIEDAPDIQTPRPSMATHRQ